MNETSRPRPHQTKRTTTYVPSRRTIRIEVPDGWARAVLSGAETVFIGWAIVTLASMTAYSTVSDNPWMGSITWENAFAFGTDLWAAALGAPVIVDSVAYTATPTLLGALLIAILRLLLRSGRAFPAAAHWFAVPTFAATSFIIVGAGANHAHWWQAWPGALLIPLIAVGWAVVQHCDDKESRLVLHDWICDGLTQGLRLTGAVVAMGFIALCAALVVHRDAIASIHALLLPASKLQDGLIIAAQVFYLPTLIAWALAWLGGPGVWIGVDAPHSPTVASTAPIPGFPVLGALPVSAPGMWVILLPIAVGVGVGVFFGTRSVCRTIGEQTRRTAVSVGVLAIVVVVWMASAVMHLGSARMALLGPHPATAAFALVAEVSGGMLAGALLTHPDAVAWLKSQWTQSLQPVGEDAQRVVSLQEESPGIDEADTGIEADSEPRADAPDESPDDVGGASDESPMAAIATADDGGTADRMEETAETTTISTDVALEEAIETTTMSLVNEADAPTGRLRPWTPSEEAVIPAVESPARQAEREPEQD